MTETKTETSSELIIIMAGPFYFLVWLVCATLYPAYESFKAVKTKNTKNYVSSNDIFQM